MSFKTEGLGAIEKQLEKMQHAAEEVGGTHEYSFSELFPPSFMQEYTDYPSIDEFLENCGFPASNSDEFEAIPEVELDAYVQKSTSFDSWDDMRVQAAQELISRKMGF